MKTLKLSSSEKSTLQSVLKSVEAKFGKDYCFVPSDAVASCSCTAHKTSCAWD